MKKTINYGRKSSKVQKNAYFSKYGEKARKVIDTLLEKYQDDGIEN